MEFAASLGAAVVAATPDAAPQMTHCRFAVPWLIEQRAAFSYHE